jgi:S-adenosylmethionine hydrolase
MIALFTDFGLHGPYTGQMKAALHHMAPSVPVIDLFADAPAGDPKASAYLLGAYAAWFRTGTVFLCVVDPGVGGERPPLIVEADGRWYVGPGNGLFELVQRRANMMRRWDITWQPGSLSASFHGRDLFAPVAAQLALGQAPPGMPAEPTRYPGWPDDLTEIVYVDRYGNAMTGMRAALLPAGAELEAAGVRIARARTFGDVPPGSLMWYANANGLAEIAAHGASAAARLRLAPGAQVVVRGPA